MVLPCNGASDCLEAVAALRPEEAAAGVGVCGEGAVCVARGYEAVLVVVEVFPLVERRSAVNMDAPFAEEVAVCGAALRD